MSAQPLSAAFFVPNIKATHGATMPKRIMVQCATRINKDDVKRTSIGGAEHIIISSTTLPDDIVMNGGLYPAEEIEKSFHTLERTLAPIEHPVDDKGNFLSASDPIAIHNFDAGAFNINVTRKDGRVHIDKAINVQVAMKTDRGKRLLDRVNEIETSDNPRPVHTSCGLFLEVEVLDAPMTNAAGAEYSWIGRNFCFDHDAILLDSVGAATPAQGVGMAVNANGEEVQVDRVVIEPTDPQRPAATDSRINAEGMSFGQIEEQLRQAIQGQVTADWLCLVDVFDGEAIFETPQGFFMVPWTMNAQGHVELAGIPFRVIKEVKFTPKLNSNEINSNGGNKKMKEKMVNALKEAGVETEGLTDDQIFEAHATMLTNAATEAAKVANADGGKGLDATAIANAVTEAIKPLTTQVEALATKVNADETEQVEKMATLVGNSDKYPGITVEMAKAQPIDTLKTMAANCAESHGIGNTANFDGSDGDNAAPVDMPE